MSRSSEKQIFISHSSKNKDFIRKDILPQLDRVHRKAWFDEVDIGGGDNFRETITKGVENSDRLLVVLSKECVGSEWVKTELEIGVKGIVESSAKIDARSVHRRILPVKIDERDQFGAKVKVVAPKKEANPRTEVGGTSIAFSDDGDLFVSFQNADGETVGFKTTAAVVKAMASKNENIRDALDKFQQYGAFKEWYDREDFEPGTPVAEEAEVNPFMLHPYLALVSYIDIPHNAQLDAKLGKYSDKNGQTLDEYLNKDLGLKDEKQRESVIEYKMARDKALDKVVMALRDPDTLKYGFKRFGRLMCWLAQPAVQRVGLAAGLFAALLLAIQLPAILQSRTMTDSTADGTFLVPTGANERIPIDMTKGPLDVQIRAGKETITLTLRPDPTPQVPGPYTPVDTGVKEKEIEIVIEPVSAKVEQAPIDASAQSFRLQERPFLSVRAGANDGAGATTLVSLGLNDADVMQPHSVAGNRIQATRLVMLQSEENTNPSQDRAATPTDKVVVRIKATPEIKISAISGSVDLEKAKKSGNLVLRIRAGNTEKYVQIEAKRAELAKQQVPFGSAESGSPKIEVLTMRTEDGQPVRGPLLNLQSGVRRNISLEPGQTVLGIQVTQANGEVIRRGIDLEANTPDLGPPKIEITPISEKEVADKKFDTYKSGPQKPTFLHIRATDDDGKEIEKYVKLEADTPDPGPAKIELFALTKPGERQYSRVPLEEEVGKAHTIPMTKDSTVVAVRNVGGQWKYIKLNPPKPDIAKIEVEIEDKLVPLGPTQDAPYSISSSAEFVKVRLEGDKDWTYAKLPAPPKAVVKRVPFEVQIEDQLVPLGPTQDAPYSISSSAEFVKVRLKGDKDWSYAKLPTPPKPVVKRVPFEVEIEGKLEELGSAAKPHSISSSAKFVKVRLKDDKDWTYAKLPAPPQPGKRVPFEVEIEDKLVPLGPTQDVPYAISSSAEFVKVRLEGDKDWTYAKLPAPPQPGKRVPFEVEIEDKLVPLGPTQDKSYSIRSSAKFVKVRLKGDKKWTYAKLPDLAKIEVEIDDKLVSLGPTQDAPYSISSSAEFVKVRREGNKDWTYAKLPAPPNAVVKRVPFEVEIDDKLVPPGTTQDAPYSISSSAEFVKVRLEGDKDWTYAKLPAPPKPVFKRVPFEVEIEGKLVPPGTTQDAPYSISSSAEFVKVRLKGEGDNKWTYAKLPDPAEIQIAIELRKSPEMQQIADLPVKLGSKKTPYDIDKLANFMKVRLKGEGDNDWMYARLQPPPKPDRPEIEFQINDEPIATWGSKDKPREILVKTDDTIGVRLKNDNEWKYAKVLAPKIEVEIDGKPVVLGHEEAKPYSIPVTAKSVRIGLSRTPDWTFAELPDPGPPKIEIREIVDGKLGADSNRFAVGPDKPTILTIHAIGENGKTTAQNVTIRTVPDDFYKDLIKIVYPQTPIQQGSFTAWADPQDPEPGQGYSVVIEIQLPAGIKDYGKEDLSGFLVGDDEHEQPIGNWTGGRVMNRNFSKGYFGTTDIRKMQLRVPVPGGNEKVKDIITVRSKVLNESQTFGITF